METPWERARKTKSERQEERLGNLPGGNRQINSGRFWRSKRDATLFEFLIEARTTEKGSYTISYDEFRAIEKNALQTPPGCLPGMQIDLRSLRLIVVRFDDWYDERVELLRLKDAGENQHRETD
jgi:hypothetical protein